MKADLRSLTALFAAPCILPARRRTLWTIPSMVRPALIAKEFGNADMLLGLSPISHRPCYYLVWVDARWMSSDHDESIFDHIDAIDDAICEEFGCHHDGDGEYEWPMASSGGYAWWKADAEDVLTERARKKIAPTQQGTPQ